MTKPLIQQLAERAGVNLEAAPALWHPGFIATILFELCAYLDEREKGKPEPPAAPDPGSKGHGSTVTHPSFCMRHARQEPCLYCLADSANSQVGYPQFTPSVVTESTPSVIDCEPPAAPEVAERPAIHSDPARAWPILMSRLRAMATRVFTNSYINDLANDFDDCGVAIESKLSEARAELASRCDHHAAIHELNREMVEAREQLAQAEAHNDRWSARQATAIIGLEAELAKVKADSQLGLDERNGVLHAVLAKVTAERDAIKAHHDEWFDRIVNGQGDPEKEAALATIRTCVEELAAKCDTLTAERDAMGAVVEAAREYVRVYGDAGAEVIYRAVHEFDRLTAAAAKPPEL